MSIKPKANQPENGDAQVSPKKPAAKSDAARVKTLSSIAGAAVAIALLGAGFGAWSSIQAKSAIDTVSANTEPVLVAKEEIRSGDAIEASKLEILYVPNAYRTDKALPEAALSGENAISGRLALVDIAIGTQITEGMFAGGSSTSTLAASIAPGYEAVSIAVDAESGVAGALHQNDTVRVLASSSNASGGAVVETLASGVRVVALDNALTGADGTYTSVTLEVTPQTAADIRSAQLGGKVTLVLLPSVG